MRGRHSRLLGCRRQQRRGGGGGSMETRCVSWPQPAPGLRLPPLPARPAAEYAQVLRMLGNGRLEAHCMDGVKRLCHIRGKMRKKVGFSCWGGWAGRLHA